MSSKAFNIQKRLFFLVFLFAAPVLVSSDASAAVNRTPNNIPETNTRNRCASYGGSQTGRLGSIWISNAPNTTTGYYRSVVNVSGTATSVTVQIRGSAMNCQTSAIGTVYASSIRSANPNASALTNISSTVLNRGSTTNSFTGWWTSRGSQISATLNLGTLAPQNLTSSAVTHNFEVGIYRCFGRNGNTGLPNQCAVERVPVTVVRAPAAQPFTVRSNMIAGGFNGGGGPDLNGNFSASHAITQTGSFGVSTRRNAALTFNGSTSNSNNVVVSAPYSVTDSSGRVWERQGSARCYNTSGTCRSSGVQTTIRRRTFSPDGIVNNGGTVRVYWFYRERDESPNFSLTANCSTIRVSNISDPNTTGSLSMTVSVGGEVIFSGSRSQGSHTFTYPQSRQNTSNNVVTVTVNSYVPPGSPSAGNTTRSVSVPPCYQASCSASSISAAHILAGTDFSTAASFRNNGQLSWPTSGRVTSQISYTSTRTISPLPSSTAAGNTLTINYSPYTARSDTIDRQTVNMRLYLDGTTLLATCTRSFDPYTTFELEPEIVGGRLVGGTENPSGYELQTRVNISNWSPTAGPSFNGPTATRTITRNGAGIGTFSSTGPYPTPAGSPLTDLANISDPQAGDEYCGEIIVSGSTGWINRFGSLRNVAGSASAGGGCETIYDQPYVSVFGADVIAAGDFGTTNCTGGGVIAAHFDNSGGSYRGSGSQFAAMAINQIQSFSSAKMRAPVNETAFANTGSGVGSYGGSYPGSHCITDFASMSPGGLPNEPFVNSVPVNGLASGSYNLSNGNLAASAGGVQIANGKSFTLYRDGDVYIANNIVYANDTWTDISEIPSLYLVVRGGNIYISNEVTNLDGVYVAQPDSSGDRGEIYTCGTSSLNRVPTTQLYDDCDNPLTVHGALIAKTVHFNRYGNSSLRYGSQGEYPLSGTGRTCGDDTRAVCAAEVVNFSPELYLSAPQLPVTSAPGQGGYDVITGLTPIF